LRLEGIHHITAITADARANLDFYARLLGMRFVKKTVNFDDPTAYHLYYGDELGHPGSILTFFEYPGAAEGRAGAGMIHRIVWRAATPAALEFWADRLVRSGVLVAFAHESIMFSDPEGLEHEIVVARTTEEPLRARAPGVPAAYALLGFDGVRAYARAPETAELTLGEALAWQRTAERQWTVAGDRRSATFVWDEPPAWGALQGAGTIHHIAFAAQDDEQVAWREAIVATGTYATAVIDRTYFRSVYFREPNGVLFEIATIGPGFAVDEAASRLGERLQLPPRYEHLRNELNGVLTPLENPRQTMVA
jgi:glyoxalase family protein